MVLLAPARPKAACVLALPQVAPPAPADNTALDTVTIIKAIYRPKVGKVYDYWNCALTKRSVAHITQGRCRFV